MPSSLPLIADRNARTIHRKNPPELELKRALAVQMSQRGQRYRDIGDILQVSVGFITASRQRYEYSGVEGLRSHYWGTAGYLSAVQKQELLRWLDQQDAWTLEEVIDHIEDEYAVALSPTLRSRTRWRMCGCKPSDLFASMPGCARSLGHSSSCLS